MQDDRPTVLVADDDAETTRFLREVLEGDGYRVLVAHDAPGAVALARAEHPDLLLLDTLMPGGGGYAVLRTLQADAPNRRPAVIFLTALAQPAALEAAFALGAVDYLTKPIATALLRARVRTWLHRLGKLTPGGASKDPTPPA